MQPCFTAVWVWVRRCDLWCCALVFSLLGLLLWTAQVLDFAGFAEQCLSSPVFSHGASSVRHFCCCLHFTVGGMLSGRVSCSLLLEEFLRFSTNTDSLFDIPHKLICVCLRVQKKRSKMCSGDARRVRDVDDAESRTTDT